MAIIVSAFLTNINNRTDITTNNYIEYGKKLLSIDCNKIIFIEENLIEQFKDINNKNILIPYTKNKMYLYDYIDKITNFNIYTDNINKDTIDYMFINIHKTEFIKMAINMNIFKESQYVWIDFGIVHQYNNSNIDKFEENIISLIQKKYDNVRIAGIINNYDFNNIYKNVCWIFAGGVFGGTNSKLLEFADLVKDYTINIILNKNTIMWEVNIWALIYKDIMNNDSSLISIYKCNHNPSIIYNY
jgi:hypothetical protein